MNKTIAVIGMALVIVVAGVLIFRPQDKAPRANNLGAKADAKNATYDIDGKSVTLKDGYDEEQQADDTESNLITSYFGNETIADFNNDGVPDTAFILTQTGGGSGTFFYVAALLSQDEQFRGSNAIFIGDRIAPQSTEFRNGMIVVNYADRKPEQGMVDKPTVAATKYFKVVDGLLVEIELSMSEAEARAIAEKTCIKGGEALQGGIYNENSKTWWFDANLNSVREGCNPACVVSSQTKTAEINWRCTGAVTD